jgi:hypothetical protein
MAAIKIPELVHLIDIDIDKAIDVEIETIIHTQQCVFLDD